MGLGPATLTTRFVEQIRGARTIGGSGVEPFARPVVRLEQIDLGGFERLGQEWDALVGVQDGPFLTAAWLAAWWRAFALDSGCAFVLMDGRRLLAGGCFLQRRGHAFLQSATNGHSGDWGVVAVNDAARERFWAELLPQGSFRRVELDAVSRDAGQLDFARDILLTHGYRVAEQEMPSSPWLDLPGSLDELLKERSRNLRSQVGRRRRALEREGKVTFRTSTGGPRLEEDFEQFLAVEASGWKREAGTAISMDPPVEALYREFASAASAAGSLRLHILELNDEPIAADYGCVLLGCGYLIKTGFREEFGHLAPGLVLRAEVLRASIEEGLGRYDFLGGPDAYKLRWTDTVRRRSTLYAFRGLRTVPAYAWWSVIRPGLAKVRSKAMNRRSATPSRR